MQFSFAQEKTVTGTVTDGNRLPLPAANIKGAKGSVAADVDGKFSINAKPGDVLVVTYQGYETKSITVGAANSYKVSLKENAKVLEDLVIGAMGIKRTRNEVTSAQKQIGGKELTQANNPNAIQALTAKVSGLQINTISNGVAPETRILLRGIRSVSGDNSALVVIDNSIATAEVLAQLPPEVIESVNVIKGAQGAALYGAQGVNGVIIVTTKKGSNKEKFIFGFNTSIDFENVSFVPKRQMDYGQGWGNGYQFQFPDAADPRNGNTQFSPYENGAWGPAFNDPTWAGTTVPVGLPQADGHFLTTKWEPIKDNIKKFFKTGVVLQNSFNFNVGGPDSYAFLSINRQNTDFVVQDDKLVKNSFTFKAGKKIGKFRIDGNVSYISQSTSETDPNLYDALLQTATNIPVELFNNSSNEHHWTAYSTNPYWTINHSRNNNASNIINGTLFLDYEFNKHIDVSYNANLNLVTREGQSYNDGWNNLNYTYNFAPYTDFGTQTPTIGALGAQPVDSYYYDSVSTTRNFYGDLLFNFKYNLSKDFKLKFNIGNNTQDAYYKVVSEGGTGLDVPGFYHISNVLNPANPTTLRGLGYNNAISRYRILAGFANFDLSYKDYLFLNATSRVEQKSTITKSYFYPSVGVSFIPTKAIEALNDNKVLNYAKINASYTVVGNASITAPYATNELTKIPQGFPFGNISALAYNNNPTNPNIKPEYVTTKEIGAQFGFFKDRLTLEGSYYVADTKDLITNVSTSSFSGATTSLDNVGSLQNKGYEIDLGFTPVKTNSFKWDVKANYSTYKTIVTSLASGATSVALQQNSQVGIFAEVGEQFPLIKGTAFVRDANGNVVVDANGLPQQTSTFQKLGKGAPDYTIGLSNSFEYKGFKFTAVADLRVGASAYSFAKNILLFAGGDLDTAGFDRSQGYVFPGVTTTGAPNTTAAIAASPSGVTNYFTTTHRNIAEANVIDASALKIRELSLSYTLPKKLISSAGIESLKFGVNARNPFVFLADGSLLKARHGLANNGYGDPEASNTTGNAQGIMNVGQYPTTKTYGFSINVTF